MIVFWEIVSIICGDLLSEIKLCYWTLRFFLPYAIKVAQKNTFKTTIIFSFKMQLRVG